MRALNFILGTFAVVVVVLVFSLFFGSWYTIDQGERGVILRNGAYTGVAEPGLGFKFPFIDSVQEISVQSRAKVYENIESYSRDQQPASLTISINYRIPPDEVASVYSNFGSEEGLIARLVDRKVFEQTKNVFGQFNAVTAIQERARLNVEIAEAVRNSITGPIMIESVQIEDIVFSDAYEDSIEARMLAEVEVQKLRQNAEREKVQAEITVTQARAKADAVRAQAEADGEAIRIRGQAEADAIRARGEALRDNPALIGLVQAEKWNGQLPSTMVPGSTVPFLSLQNSAQ